MPNDIEITVRPMGALPGDVIVRNPHAYYETGEWTITRAPASDGWYVAVEWSQDDGATGVFTMSPGERLTVRGRRTGAAA